MKISRIGKTGNKITAQHISTVSYLLIFSNSIVSNSSSKSVSFSPTQSCQARINRELLLEWVKT